MTHDPLCANPHLSKRECNCNLIDRVRADQRNKCIEIVSGAYLIDWGNGDLKDSEWNMAVSTAIEYLSDDYYWTDE